VAPFTITKSIPNNTNIQSIPNNTNTWVELTFENQLTRGKYQELICMAKLTLKHNTKIII